MSTETQITDWLATQQDAMVALLREMVDTDSNSYDKPGIDAVGAVIRRFLTDAGSRSKPSRRPATATCCAPRRAGTARLATPAATSC